MNQKLFDLLINDQVMIRQRPMSFICAMRSKFKREANYKNCVFTIKYNSSCK